MENYNLNKTICDMFKMGERVNCEWRGRIGPVLTLKLFNRNINLCFCHRKEERCFTVKDYTFPLCSRCCGLYTGIILSMILLWFFPISYSIFSILLMIPLVIDCSTQCFFNRESNNILRFSSGMLFSFGFLSFLGVIL